MDTLMQNPSNLSNKYRFESVFNIIYKTYLKYQYSNEKISDLSVAYLELYKNIQSKKRGFKNQIKIFRENEEIKIESNHKSFSEFCGSVITSEIDCDLIHVLALLLWRMDEMSFNEHKFTFNKISETKNVKKIKQFF